MSNVAEELTARCGPLFSIVDDPEGARRIVGLRLRGGTGSAAGTLLRLHHELRGLAGDYGLRSVHLPAGSPRSYDQAFGVRVRFGRDAGLLRLPAGLLSGIPARSDFAWRVRQALTDRLGSRSTGLADVARVLAVHPRTLQRTLADEGLTYAEILDCVRRNRARDLLRDSDLPAAVISVRLGFADPAVFSRSCRRWFGRPPASLRAG
ncbi:helix-turn-helix transcriptional regulator [Actinoplanes sp. NPDC049265]|uniref:helix-turn-helix transcriptional regulator n=1 Tax=Actinoplanes sp. NPDC049265 TaxID=3363902 RepID=UPI0037184DB7